MNAAQFERERLYQATLAVGREMLRRNLLTDGELAIFDTKMREKYKPSLGSLYPVEVLDFLDNKAFPSDI
ncbi:MAG: hypothetical protein FWE90_14105 [Defluviitaleaceae bacterium]|nr:hypothetical protein [Defluviitaleaceae bacterium]